MTTSAQVYGIVTALYWKYVSLAFGSQENREELTGKIAAQLAHELGPGWAVDEEDKLRFAYVMNGTVTSYGWLMVDNNIAYPLDIKERAARKVDDPTREIDLRDATPMHPIDSIGVLRHPVDDNT